MNIDEVLNAYLVCLLWSSTDDDGNPLDANFSVEDIDSESVEDHREQIEQFTHDNRELIEQTEMTDEQLGHDLWLTRNGHGVGFWDRGYGEAGDLLTVASKALGECWPYVGDDGTIYIG
jgi:hypothetical protein